MIQDQMRQLLAGYAADTLSADERRLLFEAALDDQELFNALQNEDALKELLDDPVTQARLRIALQPRRRAFSGRRWMLGVAIPAAIALVIVAVMNRAGAPRLVATDKAPRIAIQAAPAPAAQPAAGPVEKAENAAVPAAPPAPRLQAKKAGRGELPAPVPAVAAEARLAQPNAAPRMTANMRLLAPAVPEPVKAQLAAASAPDANLYQGPLVQYALDRSGPDGQDVRVRVTTGAAGYLALYELTPSGNVTRVYPARDDAARVAANSTLEIPFAPLKIADSGTRLRLVLVPSVFPASNGFLGGALGGVAGGGGTTLGTGAPPLAPMTVDIPLVP
jgi:hypothetical protein